MKSAAIYGTVAMVALSAQLALAAQTNPSLTRHLDRSFDKSVHTFMLAVIDYESELHYRPYHLVYETTSTMPSSTMLEASVMPNASSIAPPSTLEEMIIISRSVIKEANGNISILKNYPLLTSREKISVELLESTINQVRELLNEDAPSINEPYFIEQLRFILESLHGFPVQLDLSQKKIVVLKKRNLDDQQTKVEESEKENLGDDIIRHIKLNEFSLVAQKLRNSSDWNYVYVVQKVYDGNDMNYELLLRFVDAIQDLGQKLKICNALFNEMGDHVHLESKMLFELTQRIKTGILDRASVSTATEAQALLDTICTLDIVENLRLNKLELVRQRLEMGNNLTFQYAVSKIYHQFEDKMYYHPFEDKIYHQFEDKFNLIIRFVKFVQGTELKLKLYETLYSVMSLKDRTSTEKLLELTQCIKTEVLNRTTGATATSAQAFLNYVCTNAIQRFHQSGDFGLAAQILNMGNDETYKYAVNKLYSNQIVDFKSLLLIVNSARNLEETILIHEALYNEIRANYPNDLQKIYLLRLSINRERDLYNLYHRQQASGGPGFGLHWLSIYRKRDLHNFYHLHQASGGPGIDKLMFILYRLSHDEAICYLQLRNFRDASWVLDMCDDHTYDMCDDHTYELVVRDMYEKSHENFDLLIDFGNYMLHGDRRVSTFFQALYKVMRTNGRNDTKETLKLIQIIKAGIPYEDREQSNGVLTVLNHLLYDDVIDLIKSRKFGLAESKLVNCSHDVYIFVVKEIYDQQPNNFDVLLSFANITRDVATKFNLYDALINTTKNSTHPDRVYQLLRIYSSVKIEHYKSAKFHSDELQNAIFDQVVEPLSSGFLKNATSLKTQQLSNEISKTDIQLLYNVYDAVIKNISGNLTTAEILKRESYCVNQLIERMAVHEAIANGHMGPKDAQLLVQVINVVQGTPAYRDVPQYWRYKYEDTKIALIDFSVVLLKSLPPVRNKRFDLNRTSGIFSE